MKKLFALLFAILLPVSASALTDTEVKNAHIKNCTNIGGDRNICSCSYNKALNIMTLEELALVNSQIAGKSIVDPALAAKLEKATRECGEETQNRVDNALPPPPPPPPLPTLQPLPGNEPVKSEDRTYMEDIKSEPVAIPTIDSAELPPSKEVIEQKIAANQSETYENEELAQEFSEDYAQPEKQKRPAGYFGEYDKRFFNAIATGNATEIRAYYTRIYDINVKNQDGDNALIVAISNGQAASVSFLLSKGANVNAKNSRGQAPIHIASYIRRPDIVEQLINAGANVNIAYGLGYTPLSLAIMQQDFLTAQMLLKAKAKISKPLADGNTELHIAAVSPNPEMISLLAGYGAKINARNKAGHTPLMVAAYTGNAAVAERLAVLGANVKLKDPAGRTALTLAQSAGKIDVVNVLMAFENN